MAVRRPVNHAGLAKTGDKELMVILRDVSDIGACVRVIGSGTIPDHFHLVVPMEKIDHPCTVIWRRGRECGVEFDTQN